MSDNAIEWLVHGSQFNDRGPYGNVMFAIKFSTGDLTYRVDENNQWCGMGRARNYYCGNGENTREKAIWGDEFINQTHLGEMQFLHSMATSGGDYQFDKEKILRWMEFGVDIYNQKPIHLQDAAGNSYVKDIVDCTWEEYYGTLDDQDVMLTMVGAMLVDSVQLKKWTESRPKDSGEQIKTQQLARARSLREALRSADKKFYSPYYHMTIRDFFVDKDYGEKYGGEDICQIARFVALGTVCHMIQDSFANSHSKRAYDLFCKTSEGMELEPDTLCESNIVTVSTLPEYKRQEKIRNYLRNNVPTILLFADYAEQDGSRHAYADVWCATYEVTGNHDMSYYYKNTRNADYARDCTAAFLYMVLARCKPSEIRSFVSGIYPLQPAASDFAPTKAGYQYEKVESDVGVLGKYAIDILKTVGYNNIVSSKERLDVLYTHVMYLDDILTPKTVKHKKRRKHGRRYYNRRPKTLKQKKNDEKSACLKYRETYVRHLNEIVMELYVFACQVTGGNTKKANKNEIETSKIQIDDLLLCAQEIYEDMDREVHPFIQKARSILTPTMISE
ncbi:MAG: hypothetical protein IJ833_03410 [Lachnospiraceae bacterium]|nr:hypothetical protein [Lachnospiraceae bacterium]